MKEFSTEQVQAAFEKLPQELKDAISSADVMGKIREIGEKHNLHIDQIGELVDQVGLVMLGLKNSSSFVRDVSSKIGISSNDAQAIANDINSEVFSAIKTNMREIEEKAEQTEEEAAQNISSIEQAGGFNVEPSYASSSADGKDQNMHDVAEHDREDILSDIENPQPAPSTSEPNHYEPLVDHLLANPVGRTEQKIEHKTEEPPANLPVVENLIPVSAHPVAPKPAVKPAARPSPQPIKAADPYRESVN